MAKEKKKKGWKKIVKTVLLILLVICILKFIWGAIKPTVWKGYYNNVKPGAEIEEKFTKLGEEEIKNIEFEIDNKEVKKYLISYPKEMEENKNSYPLVIMVNGSDDPASRHYPIMEHLASWGFIVAGNEHRATGMGNSTSELLDYLLKLNEDKESIFYQKIDIENIGIWGASQGGCGALRAATEFENSHYYKSIFTASAPSPDLAAGIGWTYDIKKLNIPYFMVAGTGKQDSETVSPLRGLEENYQNMPAGVPCVYARRKDTDHEQMQTKTDAYMTAWFMYTLRNDEDAKKVFVGNNPELKQNTTNWQDVKIKNFD